MIDYKQSTKINTYSLRFLGIDAVRAPKTKTKNNMKFDLKLPFFWYGIIGVLLVSTFGLLFFTNRAESESPSWLDNAISRNEIYVLTNELRNLQQLPPLAMNEKLNAAALAKAKTIIAEDFFSHNGKNGRYFTTWIDDTGYDYQLIGENLAAGFQTNKEVLKAWMDSPTHRANILNNRYREIGIAIWEGDLEGRVQTVVVQIFGSPRQWNLSEVIFPQYQSWQRQQSLGNL
ncbi:MAG: CAP domain-containing protein [Candidatus Komeilibacteria bacterium]|nr:CAP domain-containing protein [Candidatus Komeilibacteria bacterium]